jgi:hypothetical protein
MAKTSKQSGADLKIQAMPGEEESATLARTALRPSINAAVTIKEYSRKYGELDLTSLVNELSGLAKLANQGDLGRAEATLMIQAHTLDAIFNNLAQRAHCAEYMSQLESYLRLALKAQSQCRATLETLAVIKNPAPVAFVGQANIGQAVQVNNAAGKTSEGSRARENPNLQSKLLEHQHGQRLDFGTAGAAIGADPELATVGEINRPANSGG